MEDILLDVQDVSKICNVKINTAYGIIRALNDELRKKGNFIIRGRVSKSYLCERLNIKG